MNVKGESRKARAISLYVKLHHREVLMGIKELNCRCQNMDLHKTLEGFSTE